MAQCYELHNGTAIVLHSEDQSCGPSISGVQSCCVSGDTCLENSICHYTHPLVGGSGYYVGGCTDASFPEPCSKSCTDLPNGDIVFTGAATSLWACCYQYVGANRDCSNPGNDTFYAPSPESLKRQAESSSTTSSSAISSINSSITPSSTPSASVSASTSTNSISSPTFPASIPPSSTTATNAPSSALSTGAKAGIGIAASIAGLGIMVIVGFYIFRKRHPRHHQETPAVSASDEMASSFPLTSEPTHTTMEISSDQQWELYGNSRSEMEARGKVEMEASR